MYALNIKKGTIIQHPEIDLPGLIAVRVSPELGNQLKHIINIVIFDSVKGVDNKPRAQMLSESQNKPLYGVDKKTLEPIKTK